MENIQYIKADPTGNITLLVISDVPEKDQRAAAAALMSYEPDAEQVGFIMPPVLKEPDARLRMAGGEFCGNAAMSLGAYKANETGIEGGQSMALTLEISGAEEPVKCTITKLGDGLFRGTVVLPGTPVTDSMVFEADGIKHRLTVVKFAGITHAIFPCDPKDTDIREMIEKNIRSWTQQSDAEAFGVLLFDEKNSEMAPLVCVPNPETVVWEHGCGSGTAAIGCYLASKAGQSIRADIKQDGGIIGVDARFENEAVSSVAITGQIRLSGVKTQYNSTFFNVL